MQIRELAAGETGAAHLAMLQLRPDIGDEAAFALRIDSTQRPQGYRLIGAFVDGDAQAAAVAGFREVHHLAWGHAVYCDDLSTRPEHRRAGHAGALIDWMLDEARRLGCDAFHLDSGVQPERADAHRLYFSKRMRISSFHFQLPL